jgi:hypothetical protein
MRPLLCAALVVVSGLTVGVFAPRGSATANTPGDGCMVVSNGIGKVTVKLTRGVVFGRFQEGDVTIDDLSTDDAPPSVYGTPGVKVGDHSKKYTGNLIRFRTNGPVKITINAQTINLSVVGKGTAWLSSFNFDVLPPDNVFSVDAASFCEDNFQPMPTLQKPAKYSISSPIAA